MSRRHGFTLVEIITAMIILAITATMAVPIFNNYLTQQSAKAAQNNLISIYNAQKIYYLNNAAFCLNNTAASAACSASTGDANCGDTLTAINCNLPLNITDNYFTYICSTDASGFNCQATNKTNSNLFLNVTNNPIVVP